MDKHPDLTRKPPKKKHKRKPFSAMDPSEHPQAKISHKYYDSKAKTK